MAFVDFSQPMTGALTAALASACVNASPSTIPENLTAQEWQIVSLARTDGLRSLRAPERRGWLRRWIFGEEISLSLANERLEALRRLAVEAWARGYAVSPSSIQNFRAAGFSDAQLELLLATINAGRTARGPRSFA